MYSKFKYTPTHYFYNKELNLHLEKGKEIYSDKFIRIEQEDKIITGYGFESNQELTEYQIRNTTGIFTIEDNAGAPASNVKDSVQQDTLVQQPQRIQPIRKNQ